jgi:hypothetical protein
MIGSAEEETFIIADFWFHAAVASFLPYSYQAGSQPALEAGKEKLTPPIFCNILVCSREVARAEANCACSCAVQAGSR